MCNGNRGLSLDVSYPVSFIWPNGFRGEESKKSTNQKQELSVAPCLLMDRDEMCNRNRGFSIDVSYSVSVHLAKRFQRRI